MLPSLIGAAGQVIGGGISAIAAGQQQKREQQWQSAEAQKNRDWQTEMSNTAYQRSAKDMKAAGYNPALSVAGGSPASTPSGGAATAGSAVSAIGAAIGSGTSRAIDGFVTSAIKAREEKIAREEAAAEAAKRSEHNRLHKLGLEPYDYDHYKNRNKR